MSKLSKEVLLEQIDTWISSCKHEGIKIHGSCKKCICGEICKQATQQIKEMIEKKKSKKPQVSKKWVEKWYEAILMNSGAITDEFGVRRQVYLMLKEAGVEVVNEP